MTVAPLVQGLTRSRLPRVASAAALNTYAGRTPVYVPSLGAFARLAGSGLWAPLDVHPSYSDYTVVGTLDAAALDPADPDAVVTDDLPEGFALTFAEKGLAKLTANGLELHSGDGTAVSSASSASLAFTGAMVPAADAHRTVVLARHAWADDGSIAASDAARANMSLRLSTNNRVALWVSSSANGGAAGFASTLATTGAILAAATTITDQARTEAWELHSWQRGVSTAHAAGVRRLAGPAPLGALISPRNRNQWTSVSEAANVTYLARNATAASTAVVKLYVRSLVVLRQGAAA
jgi:hypothetical protein